VGALLRKRAANDELTGAICAAPGALAAHGVFGGRAMTAHPSVHPVVAAHGRLDADAPVVVDGSLVTSQGPGTAFAFGLALVARLLGDDKAREVRGPLVLPG
jgi:protein DJ-1